MEIANEGNQLKDDPIKRNEETITEMESPKVSNQVADEAERRLNTNQVNLQEREESKFSSKLRAIPIKWEHMFASVHMLFNVYRHSCINNHVIPLPNILPVDWSTYWPLCKMNQENDWKGVEDFVANHPEALNENISSSLMIFHHLVYFIFDDGEGVASLIEKLASRVNPSTLEQKDGTGLTPLTLCAITGSTRISKILVKSNPNLPNMASNGWLPVHDAAAYGHKNTVQYLILVTAEDKLKGSDGAYLISRLILSNLYAFDLLKQYPLMGRDDMSSRDIVLNTLAEKPLAFASGSRLGSLQRFIYNCILVKKGNICFIDQTDKNQIVGGDVENGIVRSTNCLTKICQKLRAMIWKALILFVEILSMIWEGVIWNDPLVIKAKWLHTPSRFGISEIVEKTIIAYNHLLYWTNEDRRNAFGVAILHRQEKVFNLIYRFRSCKDMLSGKDNRNNNMLHLAAVSAPSSEVAGAALQMQRELQWYKAVEELMHPADREKKNHDKQTPIEVFTKSHKDLVKEGEKWMKDTATSCTVAVALIITVVFAAAFAAPDGNNDNGLPNLLNDQAFMLFVVSDSLALFSSTTSLLMFLGILTSRYAEEDFLISLPRKLIIGLVTLFFTVASMMAAFGATIYLVISYPWKWVIIPVSLLGCVPVTLFALLQFPFLLDMIKSTYGPSIFGPNK